MDRGNDIIQGTVQALDYEGGFEIFNLGNSHSEPLMDMIGYLETFLGKKAHIEWKPMQPGEVQETYASIEKAEKHLGFQPKMPLKEGLERFVQWYLPHHHLPILDGPFI